MESCCLRERVARIGIINRNCISNPMCLYRFVLFLFKAIPSKLLRDSKFFFIRRFSVWRNFLYLFFMVIVSWFPVN